MIIAGKVAYYVGHRTPRLLYALNCSHELCFCTLGIYRTAWYLEVIKRLQSLHVSESGQYSDGSLWFDSDVLSIVVAIAVACEAEDVNPSRPTSVHFRRTMRRCHPFINSYRPRRSLCLGLLTS